jgi:hypothetical protein
MQAKKPINFGSAVSTAASNARACFGLTTTPRSTTSSFFGADH